MLGGLVGTAPRFAQAACLRLFADHTDELPNEEFVSGSQPADANHGPGRISVFRDLRTPRSLSAGNDLRAPLSVQQIEPHCAGVTLIFDQKI